MQTDYDNGKTPVPCLPADFDRYFADQQELLQRTRHMTEERRHWFHIRLNERRRQNANN